MKKYSLIIFTLFITYTALAQTEVSRDANGSKVLKGFISLKDLSSDTAFLWYANNQKNFTPDQNAVNALKANKDSINIITFGGTWCEDTQNLLPQFFSLINAAGFSPERLTLLGVDRDKNSTQNLSEAFNITHVPTFIVMKDGKEIGRVVEYGKIGSPIKEIGDIINKAAAK